MKFLVFAPEPAPLQDAVATAAALRTSGLASGLRAHGHAVEVATSGTGLDPTRCVHAARPEVVVCGAGASVPFEAPLPQPLVLDLGGASERGSAGPPAAVSTALGRQLQAIAQADYFLVSGPRQRLFGLSLLLRSGVERAETRMAVVPMPLSPELPADARPVSGGGGFPRVVSLRALSSLSYEALLAELAGADIATDLAPWSLEGEITLGLSSAAALWSGVPLACREDTDVADLVHRYDAGWVVEPGGSHLPQPIVEEISANPAIVGRKAEGARQLAREVFSWERAVVPLLEMVQGRARSPRREMDVSIAIPEDASLEVLKGRPIEQSFLSRVDGLCRVECCLSRRGRSRVAPVILSLYRIAGNPLGTAVSRVRVARRPIPDPAIRDNDWVELDFDPIEDSAGSTFTLVIESEARQGDESVALWACNTRLYPLLELRQDDRPLPAKSLCFRATSARSAF